MQERVKNKDVEDQRGWRQELAKLFIEYDIRATRTAEVLRYCTKESIIEQKRHIIRYLLTCFESWMTTDMAIYAFEKFLSPHRIDNTDISFTPVHEELLIKKREGVGAEGIHLVNYINIHITSKTTKKDLLNYVSENWEIMHRQICQRTQPQTKGIVQN
jgi:hypothetical protein